MPRGVRPSSRGGPYSASSAARPAHPGRGAPARWLLQTSSTRKIACSSSLFSSGTSPICMYALDALAPVSFDRKRRVFPLKRLSFFVRCVCLTSVIGSGGSNSGAPRGRRRPDKVMQCYADPSHGPSSSGPKTKTSFMGLLRTTTGS